MIDPVAVWRELPPPGTALTWSAVQIASGVRIARTPSGGAAVLVEAGTVVEQAFGLRTAHISYDPRRELVIEDSRAATGTFAVLECDGEDTDLLNYFLGFARTLNLASTTASVFDAEVRDIFELFRMLTQRGTGTAQGLWAELALIAMARDPSYLVQAWHSDPDDLHDFVGDGYRLEVKSTTRGIREHEFSLEQLERAPETTLIVSMMMQEESSGASVFDLLDATLGRLANDGLRQRAQSIVAKTLGESWREASTVRFDLPTALASVDVYAAYSVPRVPAPIPRGVRNVRFVADLSGVDTSASSPNTVWLAATPLGLPTSS